MRTNASYVVHRFLGVGAVGLLAATGLSIGGCKSGGKRPPPTTVDVAPEPAAHEVTTRELRNEAGELVGTRDEYEGADGALILHGKLTNLWQNGRKKSEVNYVHGVKQGPRTAWYANGQMWSYGEYVDDREDGTWTVWLSDGRKAQEFHYRLGAWHGLQTEWHINGQKKLEREWVKGKIQGTVTTWDENGNVQSQVEYLDSVAQP